MKLSEFKKKLKKNFKAFEINGYGNRENEKHYIISLKDEVFDFLEKYLGGEENLAYPYIVMEKTSFYPEGWINGVLICEDTYMNIKSFNYREETKMLSQALDDAYKLLTQYKKGTLRFSILPGVNTNPTAKEKQKIRRDFERVRKILLSLM